LGEEIRVRHEVLEKESLEEDQGPRIIDSEEYQAKPMSVEEAVMQMDLMNSDFLVFTNSVTKDVNVIYRRRDGNIGLIEAKKPQD
jgi:putative sigma-54 modulation protein